MNWSCFGYELIWAGPETEHDSTMNWSWLDLDMNRSWKGHQVIMGLSGTDHESYSDHEMVMNWSWLHQELTMSIWPIYFSIFHELSDELITDWSWPFQKMIMSWSWLIINWSWTYAPMSRLLFVFSSKQFLYRSIFGPTAGLLWQPLQFPENSTTKTHHDLDIS